MQNLEPSYLRYIYDGLEKGDLHPDNAAALPEGLIGLYDEAFEENKPARERQKLLETFAVWALLKKEVSAQFVAEILDEKEEDLVDFINTYSKWFNSPESGKFQLYHERLKVYLLQKLSEKELNVLHQKLISRLEQAIVDEKEDEFEYYALEFLSHHLELNTYIGGDYQKLYDFVNDQKIWDKQIIRGKNFQWSQNGILLAKKTAVLKNLEIETIQCSVNSIKLWHKELIDFDGIIQIALDGEIGFALYRLKRFESKSQNGQEIVFLC